MADHIFEWLGAYHDGELSGARLRQVEAHLADCTACRAELTALRDLSSLLQANDPEAGLLPTERFAANLALQLPRRPERAPKRRAIEIGWWLVPAGLLAAWVFLDVALSLRSLAAVVSDSGLFTGLLNGLRSGSVQMGWFAAAMRLFGEQLGGPGLAIASSLNAANVAAARLLGRFLPQAVVVAAYLGWLIAWWLGARGSRSAEGRAAALEHK